MRTPIHLHKFVIDEMSGYISEYTPNLKTEEILNRRLNSKKPLNVLLRIRARRRAIGHVTRIATASPTGMDNSVVTLLGLPPETSHGWGFNPTTTQSADHPREIG